MRVFVYRGNSTRIVGSDRQFSSRHRLKNSSVSSSELVHCAWAFMMGSSKSSVAFLSRDDIRVGGLYALRDK